MANLTFNEWVVYINNELEKTKKEIYDREHSTISRSDIKFAENGKVRINHTRQTEISNSIQRKKASRKKHTSSI